MKPLLLTGIFLLAASIATAESFVVSPPEHASVPVVPDFSGAYIGAFGGYDFATVSDNYDSIDLFTFPARGISGGLMAGYNIQNGALVYGIEGAYDFSGPNGTSLCDAGTTPVCGGSGTAPEYSVNNTTNIKARVGFVRGRALYFASAGWAGSSVTVNDPLQGGLDTQNLSGYTLGVGAEWMLGAHLSLGLDYQYSTFSAVNFALITTPDVIGYSSNAISASARWHF